MIEVKLPFSSLFVCQFCGNSSSSQGEIEKCEAVPAENDEAISVGETLSIRHRIRQGHRFIGMSLSRRPYRVIRVFYAMPGQRIGLDEHYLYIQPKPHQLCMELRSVNETGEQEDYLTITDYEFALWQRGGVDDIRKAGLLEWAKRPYGRAEWEVTRFLSACGGPFQSPQESLR